MQEDLIRLGKIRDCIGVLSSGSPSEVMQLCMELEIRYDPESIKSVLDSLTDDRKTTEARIKRNYDNEMLLKGAIDSKVLEGMDAKDREATGHRLLYEKRAETSTKVVCNFCHKWNPGNFMRCSRCKSVCYCSRDCQVQDWSEHKKNCAVKECTAS